MSVQQLRNAYSSLRKYAQAKLSWIDGETRIIMALARTAQYARVRHIPSDNGVFDDERI